MRDLPAGRRGLSAADVASRRARHGPNDVIGEAPSSLRALVADTARDPMLWFLIVTGAIYAWIGETTEAVVLIASIVPLVAMDAYLHRRTQLSTRSLAARLAESAEAVRDGQARRIAARDLVPGDLVHVHAGELVPADGVVLGGEEMQVDESALTGEAVPVRKRALESLPRGASEALIGEQHWALAGTRLLAGHADVRIVWTGASTIYGELTRQARGDVHVRTPLQRSVDRLVATLSAVAVAACVALAWVRWRQGAGWADALISAVTLAVAALPEEFPIVLTFFLGAGVYRLARRRALVRRAVVVENIGRVTCICTDKTGTLTEGRLSVARCVAADEIDEATLLEIASLASRGGTGDPLDDAILRAAGVVPPQRVLARFPFTEDRRHEGVVLAEGQAGASVIKGAPEVVLARCDLEPGARAAWLARADALAASGHKVIACADCSVELDTWRGEEPKSGYRVRGLIGCADPVRAGARDAVRAALEAGIRIVMVTGDHPATARAVARAVGLGGGEPRVVLAGDALAPEADVVARAMPAQKVALVRALQRAGHVVAVTGDGVNDVPALRAADVGIAMGDRGTTSAREIGSIVLMDDELQTIVRAIAEGQQLFRNLQHSFAYLLTVHVPLVASAALIPFTGHPLLYLPMHVVWLELIIHPSALLAFQTPSREIELGGPRTSRARFFEPRAWARLALVGAITTLAVVGGYLRALGHGSDVEHARAMALVTLLAISASATTALSRLRTTASRVIVAATLASALIVVQVPALARLVSVTPLHADDWLLAAVAGLAPMLLALGGGARPAHWGAPAAAPPARRSHAG